MSQNGVANIAINMRDVCLQLRILAFAKIGRETFSYPKNMRTPTQHSTAGRVRSNLIFFAASTEQYSAISLIILVFLYSSNGV